MSRPPSLTVLGLDAATPTVVEPLVAAGELPNLARILAEGSSGVLRSVTHPLTPHAWATMTTGVNAGRHGVWDFMERDGYRLRLVNGSARRAPAVWDRLSQAHRRSGIVNVPFTWPAPPIDGFSIAGFDAAARDEGMTWPAGVLDELRGRFGPLELDHRFPIGADGRVDLDRVRRAAEQKVEAVAWLAERFEPDLLFVVFMAADHVQHICWADWERDGPASPVAETYRILDAAVGELVSRTARGGDVIVVSDHGAGPLDGVVNLNAWLAAEGYLAYAGAEAALGRRAFDRLFAVRRWLPEGLRTSVKQRIPTVRERAYELSSYSVVDWPRTRAFAYGTFGNVVLNVRGREESGIVEPGEDYDRLRDELVTRLGELRSPAGEPIVKAVHRREELFYGDELEKLPDLVVEFDEYAWLGKGSLRTRSSELADRIEIEPGEQPFLRRQPPARGRDRDDRAVGRSGRDACGGDRRRRADAPLSARRADPGRSRRPRPRRGGTAGARRLPSSRVRHGRRDRARRAGGVLGGRVGRGRGALARPRLPRVADPRDSILHERPKLADELAIGRDRPAAPRRVRRDCCSEVGWIDDETDQACGVEPASERNLVVVDGLVVAGESRDDDRLLAVRERGHDRPDSGMRDDDARPANELDEIVVGEVVDVSRTGRPDGGRSVLDDQLLVSVETAHPLEQPIEAGLVRPDGDEDHRLEKTLPAKRARGRRSRSSGH